MKKTRTILCRDEAMEQKVYNYCNKYNIKNKNIATWQYGDQIAIDIFCGKKKWEQIRFKLNLGKWFY